MIFVNFKTYEQGTGQRAIELVRALSSVQEQTNIPIIPVVQVVDAYPCTRASTSEVWVQHVDGVEYGRSTGWILPEAVAAAGVKGTFLNHSEHKLNVSRVSSHISRCKEVGLKTLIFASDVEELKEIVSFNPDFVAYEPPELIASKETSVAKAKPEIIKQAVEVAGEIPLIVGAGVKDEEEVRVSLTLGAKGVAVSSAVVLANDPEKELRKLAEAFNAYNS